MTYKELSKNFDPNLKFPWKDLVFEVQEPPLKDGLLLTTVLEMGWKVADAQSNGLSVDEMIERGIIDPDDRELAEAWGDRDLAEVSLGVAYQEMVDAGLPASHIETFGTYAAVYWSKGEEAADFLMEQTLLQKEVAKRPVPKDRLPRKNTSNTGSASQSAKTKTASKSTQTTDSQKKPVPVSKKNQPDKQSDGLKSSSTGS